MTGTTAKAFDALSESIDAYWGETHAADDQT